MQMDTDCFEQRIKMIRIVLTIKEIMMNYGNSFTVLFILFSLNMNVHQCPCN